jgi:acylphosphatase
MNNSRTCERWTISGRVQGVGYREWMVGAARAFDVDGWVRNVPDGRVVALVAGSQLSVAQLHDQALRGPSAANVKTIERQHAPDSTHAPSPFARLPNGSQHALTAS